MKNIDSIDSSVFSYSKKLRILSSWKTRLNSEYDRYFDYPDHLTQQDMEDMWLKYLLDLAIEYCISQNALIRTVYISERFRYFSKFHDCEARKMFFREVIEKDNQAIIAEAPNSIKGLITTRLLELHHSIFIPKKTNFKLVIVGDCLFNEILTNLEQLCSESAMSLDIKHHYFGAYLPKEFDDNVFFDSDLDSSIDAIALSFFTYWGIPQFRVLLLSVIKDEAPNIDWSHHLDDIFAYIHNFISRLRESTSAPILLHNASGIPWLLGGGRVNNPIWKAEIDQPPAVWEVLIGEINSRIDAITIDYENIILIDERKAIVEHGRQKCSESIIDPKFWFGSIFHTYLLGYLLSADYFSAIFSIVKLKQTKVILVDFDNTLWEGVMAEGRVNHYWTRQTLLKRLAREGILLVALSKNNIENIRWSELVISKSDFVQLYLTWKNKPDVIPTICRDLNLSKNSFVFIDDCQRQLSLMSHYYPEVVCLDAKDDITWSQIALLSKMKNTSGTKDAQNRVESYKANLLRQNSAEKNLAAGEHSLMPLNIQVEVSLAQKEDLDRCIELLTRTNQFNCTGQQFSKAELSNMLDSLIWEIRKYQLRDNFGDMRHVGLIILNKKLASKTVIFSAFVMSCRAMGYGLETFMVLDVLKNYRQWKSIGVYKQTDKNTPCKHLFSSLLFKPWNGNEWYFDETMSLPKNPEWINQSSS